jgi:apolipoprotein D and lipocalin family protein
MTMKSTATTFLLCCMLTVLASCTGVPEGIAPIKNFDGERYLGKWYEIARLDHSFERGLSKVSATYSMRNDGGIKVINRGYNAEAGEWSEAEGKAYFTQSPDIGALKVSFFGPFYGAYNIIALDKEYQWVLVCGNNREYLWILSRTPQLDKKTMAEITALAQRWGFATSELIIVEQ